jgi:hypothetical protein
MKMKMRSCARDTRLVEAGGHLLLVMSTLQNDLLKSRPSSSPNSVFTLNGATRTPREHSRHGGTHAEAP